VNSVLDINGTGALVIPDIDAVILAFPLRSPWPIQLKNGSNGTIGTDPCYLSSNSLAEPSE